MEIKYTGMELKLHRHGIRTALASVFGAMLIATPFVGDSALANGIVTGKVFWFHLSMALMAIGTVVTAWPGGRKSIPFALPDGLLLLFAGITLATYDWQLDPEPEKLLFGGQLVVLWFLLRYFLTEAPCLKFFFLFVLMLTGLVEAVWGMQQLHGNGTSHQYRHNCNKRNCSILIPSTYSFRLLPSDPFRPVHPSASHDRRYPRRPAHSGRQDNQDSSDAYPGKIVHPFLKPQRRPQANRQYDRNISGVRPRIKERTRQPEKRMIGMTITM